MCFSSRLGTSTKKRGGGIKHSPQGLLQFWKHLHNRGRATQREAQRGTPCSWAGEDQRAHTQAASRVNPHRFLASREGQKDREKSRAHRAADGGGCQHSHTARILAPGSCFVQVGMKTDATGWPDKRSCKRSGVLTLCAGSFVGKDCCLGYRGPEKALVMLG